MWLCKKIILRELVHPPPPIKNPKKPIHLRSVFFSKDHVTLALCRAQASIAKLNELRSANMDLSRQISDTKKDNDELANAKERLHREMERLREELRNVKADLGTAESKRVDAMEEVKSMQQLLFDNKNDVRMHVCARLTCIEWEYPDSSYYT